MDNEQINKTLTEWAEAEQFNFSRNMLLSMADGGYDWNTVDISEAAFEQADVQAVFDADWADYWVNMGCPTADEPMSTNDPSHLMFTAVFDVFRADYMERIEQLIEENR